MRVSAGRRVSADRLTRGAASFVRIFFGAFLEFSASFKNIAFLVSSL
jgi:hypothetical protein